MPARLGSERQYERFRVTNTTGLEINTDRFRALHGAAMAFNEAVGNGGEMQRGLDT